MCHFLLVIFSLIIASAAEMSPAATREFRRCSPQWVNASQVKVSCSDIQIAQYCDSDQSCRNMSKPGVSLEKDWERVLCLTITNCSYDSWSCEALSYNDGEEFRENFTVHLTCNQPTSTLPSPGPTSTSATLGSASTLPSPGNESQSGPVSAWVTVLIIVSIIFGLIIFGLYICYKKVKCFRKAIGDIFCHQQSINRTPREEHLADLEGRKKFLES